MREVSMEEWAFIEAKQKRALRLDRQILFWESALKFWVGQAADYSDDYSMDWVNKCSNEIGRLDEEMRILANPNTIVCP